jgi:hypothetical protein
MPWFAGSKDLKSSNQKQVIIRKLPMTMAVIHHARYFILLVFFHLKLACLGIQNCYLPLSNPPTWPSSVHIFHPHHRNITEVVSTYLNMSKLQTTVFMFAPGHYYDLQLSERDFIQVETNCTYDDSVKCSVT